MSGYTKLESFEFRMASICFDDNGVDSPQVQMHGDDYEVGLDLFLSSVSLNIPTL